MNIKKIILFILISGLGSSLFAQKARIFKRGDIEIKLNPFPCVSIEGRPKICYLDEKSKKFHSTDMVFNNEQLDFLADNIVITRSITKKVAEEIKKRNPYVKYISYTSSTYLKHWPVEEIESKYMMHLAMSPAAVLKEPIDSKTKVFYVSPYNYPENEITKPYYNKVSVSLEEATTKWNNKGIRHRNDLIPIYASLVKQGWSKNQYEFIFFIRIDKELMRVDEWDIDTGKLTVLRGYNGSSPVPHKKGDVATSPIYCATGNPVVERAFQFTSDKSMAKLNKKKEKHKKPLDYCSDKGPANIPILERRAQELFDIITKEGFDGTELDSMSADIPQFRMVNAIGMKAAPWNFAKNRPYSVEEWVEGHDRMIGVMQRYVYERLGRWPLIGANGVSCDNFEKGEGDGGYCKRLLIPTELKPRPMDSYNSEKGLAVIAGNFKDQLRMLQTSFQEVLSPRLAMKASDKSLSKKEYDDAIFYASAFLYLAFEPKKEGWDIKKDKLGVIIGTSVISPFLDLAVGPEWTPKGGQTYKLGLPYTLYLPLGKPLNSPKPGDFNAIRYKDTNVFIRRYENGLVLINPTSANSKWDFKGTEGEIDQEQYKDGVNELSTPAEYTVKLDQRYIDSRTGKYAEGEIKIRPRTGYIFLIKPSL